ALSLNFRSSWACGRSIGWSP
ncbi:MAG: hypothetical protein KJZ52_00655, partial [Anaerolineales bacterium]|nr:hypothetical protein [Anaerolineales bacterium]